MFRLLSYFLLLCVLGGCATKTKEATLSPIPDKPEEKAVSKSEDKKDRLLTYAEDAERQYVVVHEKSANGNNEPEELVELLEAKGTAHAKETAAARLRPEAMRDAANLVALQSAMSYEYARLVQETERYAPVLDTAFNFSPLMMTHGDALIMPPILTKAGASMRLDNTVTVSTAKTTYELLENAKYVSIIPTWRTFLMADAFPKAEKPNPAVLPQNSEERKLWRSLVREAWTQGIDEARELYAANMARMTQSYRGIMLYHRLTAQHLLSKITLASAHMDSQKSSNGSKLHIGQKVYRITSPSRFLLKGKK